MARPNTELSGLGVARKGGKKARRIRWAVFAGTLMTALPSAAQIPPVPPLVPTPPTPTARIIEWDLPSQGDSQPGAVVVDTLGEDRNRVWFVTRAGSTGSPHVYRLETPKSLMTANARWTGWALDALVTGGLKKVRASHDRRFVYVRTVNENLAAVIERVDTQSCSGGSCDRVEWSDPMDPTEVGLDVSDLTVDSYNNVFTSHTPFTSDLAALQDQSYVQMLTPQNGGATVTRWMVGGGAGLCGTGTGADTPSEFTPCISGIAVHPTNRNLVYYSEPSSNNIAELNTATNNVRRWSLTALAATGNVVAGPRQVNVDRWGMVWVVTGSGHLVKLDPCANQMSAYQLPDSAAADPFGIAPDDDAVGYTASRTGISKVGMLLPKGRAICVNPVQTCATKTTKCLSQTCARAQVASAWVCPKGKTVAADVMKDPDGSTYIEAQIGSNGNDSQNPLGLTPVKSKSQGTFFYAVGFNSSMTTDPNNPSVPVAVNRIGFVRLPVMHHINHPRDDDDSNDGDKSNHSWHNWHGHATDDDSDDDGFEDDQDTPTAYETVQRTDSAALAGGGSIDFPITASATTLALIAKADVDNPLAQIAMEIHDARGVLIATSVPAPGLAVAQVLLPAAGNYTCRFRNYGAVPVNYVPTLIVREPVDPLDGPDPLLSPIIQ
jgi:hypothetical protein